MTDSSAVPDSTQPADLFSQAVSAESRMEEGTEHRMEEGSAPTSSNDAEDDIEEPEGADRPRAKRYTIGEVAERVDLEAHVLRYWESEFSHLAPGKDAAGRRIYTDADIDIVKRIQHLLKEEMYTIAGARAVLDREGVHGRKAFRDQLQEMRDFLVQLRDRL